MKTGLHENYIDGRWSASSTTLENVNPSDLTDIVGHYAQADAEDVERAVEGAQRGAQAWAESGLEARQAVLRAIGDELIARKNELGRLLAREEGKPVHEGVGEVHRSGQFFHYYAAEALRQKGDKIDSVRPGIEIETRREPMGVVAVITPWNFPMAIAAWKVAPALAYGNSVVLKPANEVPASAWALAEIISRQDLPRGTFNLLMGSGSPVGERLASSAKIDALTFTGSAETGKHIAASAMANLTKLQMEMGSKNALVVLDDADLACAVECAIAGGYSGSGQKCTASSRIVVTEAMHDRFVSRLSERVSSLRVGNALSDGTQIGPLINARQLDECLKYVDIGQQEGARVVCGGRKLELATAGHYMEPCLLADTDNTMRVNREEMFGPIACVIRVRDYEQALATVNDTRFGLAAGIVTQSLKHATHFKRKALFGVVTVNLPTAGTDYHVPFGGRRDSSYGPREQGTYAQEFYTEIKTTYVRAE